MKIKIFTGAVTTAHDINNVEQQVNDFVSRVNFIDIKQSVSPIAVSSSIPSHLLVITVMYE